MSHTFLLEPGRWTLQGNWLEKDGLVLAVRGQTLIAWSPDGWFTMVTRLVFPNNPEREKISLQYRGRLSMGEREYTFVLQHSQLGRIEGEGWIAPESILQRYWVLGDRQKRSGFETMYRLNENTYHFSSALMVGNFLNTAMEVRLDRQAEQ